MLMSRNQIRRCSALIPFTRQCIVTLLSVFNALTIVPAVLDNYKSTTALSVNMVNLACVLFINNFTCNDRNCLITCNMHTCYACNVHDCITTKVVSFRSCFPWLVIQCLFTQHCFGLVRQNYILKNSAW